MKEILSLIKSFEEILDEKLYQILKLIQLILGPNYLNLHIKI